MTSLTIPQVICEYLVIFALSCDDPINNCYRLLDLTGPLQLGGLPDSPDLSSQLEVTDFTGCMSSVHLDNKLVDLDAYIAEDQTTPGCPPKQPRCLNAPCKLGEV